MSFVHETASAYHSISSYGPLHGVRFHETNFPGEAEGLSGSAERPSARVSDAHDPDTWEMTTEPFEIVEIRGQHHIPT